MRVCEVRENPSPLDIEEAKQMGHQEVKEMMLIDIRRTNSKTGYPRVIAAPVKTIYESVITIQKMLGSDLKGNDYLFMNPTSKDRKYYTREVFARKVKKMSEEFWSSRSVRFGRQEDQPLFRSSCWFSGG